MSVVEELRQNDPARTDITISLRHETSDADLARALEQNSFITDIEFELDKRSDDQLESFIAGDCYAGQPG